MLQALANAGLASVAVQARHIDGSLVPLYVFLPEAKPRRPMTTFLGRSSSATRSARKSVRDPGRGAATRTPSAALEFATIFSARPAPEDKGAETIVFVTG